MFLILNKFWIFHLISIQSREDFAVCVPTLHKWYSSCLITACTYIWSTSFNELLVHYLKKTGLKWTMCFLLREDGVQLNFGSTVISNTAVPNTGFPCQQPMIRRHCKSCEFIHEDFHFVVLSLQAKVMVADYFYSNLNKKPFFSHLGYCIFISINIRANGLFLTNRKKLSKKELYNFLQKFRVETDMT